MKKARVIYNPTSGKELIKKNLADILSILEDCGYESFLSFSFFYLFLMYKNMKPVLLRPHVMKIQHAMKHIVLRGQDLIY